MAAPLSIKVEETHMAYADGVSPGGLERFVAAQDLVYDRVRAELAAGKKASHWMWYVFPQMRGLGHSEMAWRFGVASLSEAQAYLAHPVLGGRLKNCVEMVLAAHAKGSTLREILGYPDDMKLRSCLTLFARAEGRSGQFHAALGSLFDDEADQETLGLLK